MYYKRIKKEKKTNSITKQKRKKFKIIETLLVSEMFLKKLSKLSKSTNCITFINKNNFHSINNHQVKISTSLSNVQKRNASAFKFVPDVAPASLGETTKMNLCQSITNALDISLSSDKTAGKLLIY